MDQARNHMRLTIKFCGLLVSLVNRIWLKRFLIRIMKKIFQDTIIKIGFLTSSIFCFFLVMNLSVFQ